MITKSNHRLNRLRFRDLELLLALAETGSLRRAAVVLGVSQPALSKSLREIEDAFQVPLYVRHRSGLRPTPAGERLQAAAEVMINELAFTRSAVQATRVEPIRLGVTPLAARLLPRVLHALPRPFATISEATVPDLLAALEHGKLDAILANYPDGAPGETLAHERLFRQRLVVIADPTVDIEPSWAALSEAGWILPPPHSLVRRTIEAHFRTAGYAPPTPIVESVLVSTNVELVAHGLGISTVPESAMLEAEAAGRVRRIAVKPMAELPPVSLVYRRATAHHPRMRGIRSAVRTALAQTKALPGVRRWR